MNTFGEIAHVFFKGVIGINVRPRFPEAFTKEMAVEIDEEMTLAVVVLREINHCEEFGIIKTIESVPSSLYD